MNQSAASHFYCQCCEDKRRWQISKISPPSMCVHIFLFCTHISVVKITVAALKLQVSGVAILSVQFLIPWHASSSICICLVWRICMMPDAFLMCAASASQRVLAEPFWKAQRSPERNSPSKPLPWRLGQNLKVQFRKYFIKIPLQNLTMSHCDHSS